MKIAIVCSYYPWPPAIGGVETIVRDVSIELAKRGHEVHVITTPFDVTTMKQVTGYGLEERDGVTIHKLKPGRLKIGYARFIKGLKENMEKIKPEIVHAHNLHPHLFQLAMWKEELKYKLVAELHHPALTIDHFLAKLAFPLVAWRLNSLSSNVDVFIAHTKSETKWLLKRRIGTEKIRELFFPGIPAKLLNRKLRTTNSHSLLFIGRVIKTKGLHTLIRAMSIVVNHVKDASLTIAGPADNNYYNKLTKLICDLNLVNHIAFRNPVFGEEKWDLIANSALLVLPSVKEYTPNVVIEAQALGVPVVATRVGAVPEMVLDGETGLLVKAEDPYELAKSIAVLIGNEDLRRSFSVKAREWAKKFTLESAVTRLEEMYEYALRRNS